MKKNIVQDVVFPKRSIREVELPSRRKESSFSASEKMTERPARTRPVPISKQIEEPRETGRQIEREVEMPDDQEGVFNRRVPPSTPRASYTFDYNNDMPVHKESRMGLWISLALFIIALGFGVSALFVSAQVTISPKTQVLPVNVPLTASKDRPSGEFGYQVVSISASTEKAVPAGAVQKVDKKATGTIIIYNNTSEATQKLIANTRFESPDGKVFRIASAVTIPGRKTENGKVVPGSVEATVTADQAGESYNLGLSDFTVPGLKGDPRYTTIYARSKGSMTGGFSGNMKVVDPTLEQATEKELEATLKAKLKSDITSQIPVDFVLYDGAISYQIETVNQKAGTDDSQATLELKGTAHALIFDKALLSKAVIDSVSSSVNALGQNLFINNLNTLSFILTGTSQISQTSTAPVTFTLTGDAQVEWLYDESQLKNDLLGIKKADLSSVLQAKYPSIESARVKVYPLWKRSFPIDPNKVTIIKALP